MADLRLGSGAEMTVPDSESHILVPAERQRRSSLLFPKFDLQRLTKPRHPPSTSTVFLKLRARPPLPFAYDDFVDAWKCESIDGRELLSVELLNMVETWGLTEVDGTKWAYLQR